MVDHSKLPLPDSFLDPVFERAIGRSEPTGKKIWRKRRLPVLRGSFGRRVEDSNSCHRYVAALTERYRDAPKEWAGDFLRLVAMLPAFLQAPALWSAWNEHLRAAPPGDPAYPPQTGVVFVLGGVVDLIRVGWIDRWDRTALEPADPLEAEHRRRLRPALRSTFDLRDADWAMCVREVDNVDRDFFGCARWPGTGLKDFALAMHDDIRAAAMAPEDPAAASPLAKRMVRIADALFEQRRGKPDPQDDEAIKKIRDARGKRP